VHLRHFSGRLLIPLKWKSSVCLSTTPWQLPRALRRQDGLAYRRSEILQLGMIINKKTVLSQRWPRNAPYTWVHWKFSGLPDCAHGYYSPHFSWDFVRIDPLNVPTKFEVHSFTRSSDNRGHPKNLDSPWTRPRSLFSKIFNGLLFRLTL